MYPGLTSSTRLYLIAFDELSRKTSRGLQRPLHSQFHAEQLEAQTSLEILALNLELVVFIEKF